MIANLEKQSGNLRIKNKILKNIWEDIKFNLKDIVNSGLHIGSQLNLSKLGTSWSWSSIVNGMIIFNITIIYYNLRLILKKLQDKSNVYSDILYANFNKGLVDFIENWALKTGVLYVVGRWFRGGLSNFKNFYAFVQACRYDSIRFQKYGKYFRGVFKITKIPEIVFLSSNRDNFSKVLINETYIYGTAILILLNDTLVDPKGWSYVIPGNEKSVKTLEFIYQLFYDHIVLGKWRNLTKKTILLENNKIYYNKNMKHDLYNNRNNTNITNFFDNQKYMNRFINWFQYVRNRVWSYSINNRIEQWNGSFSIWGLKKPSSKQFWFHLLTRNKILRRLEYLRWKTKESQNNNQMIKIMKKIVDKPNFKRLSNWKDQKKNKFLSKHINLYYKPLNYLKKVNSFQKNWLFLNSLKNYYNIKKSNFENFYKKLKKSESLNILLKQEVEQEFSRKFNRRNKIASQIWEFYDNRNIENWWITNRHIYNDLKKFTKLKFDEKSYKSSDAFIEKHGDQSFNFNKLILKNNLFKSKYLYKNQITFATHCINFENECIPNENYFKSKKKITVIRYKNEVFKK